jgi:hypothetical protein
MTIELAGEIILGGLFVFFVIGAYQAINESWKNKLESERIWDELQKVQTLEQLTSLRQQWWILMNKMYKKSYVKTLSNGTMVQWMNTTEKYLKEKLKNEQIRKVN